MSQSFDPYLRWLGIRDPQRPPNHYRLLGIDLFESDPDIIAGAADRQMAHIRSFQTGQYAELSQKILNELAAARVCLLKPPKKADYDAQLRANITPLRPQPVAAVASPVQMAQSGSAATASGQAHFTLPSQTIDDILAPVAASRRSREKRKPTKSLAPMGLIVVALLAMVTFGLFAFQQFSGPVALSGGKSTRSKKEPTKPTRPPRDVPESSTAAPDSSATSSVVEESPPKPNGHTPIVEESLEPDSVEVDPGDSAIAPLDTTSTTNTKEEQELEVPIVKEPPGETPIPSTPSEQSSPSEVSDELPEIGPVLKQDGRLPLPSDDDQKAATQRVREVFGADLDQAKSADAKAALAKTLLAQASESHNDHGAEFILLKLAEDFAIEAGQVALVQEIVGRRGAHFAVNALEEKVDALMRMQRQAKAAEIRETLPPVAAQLIEVALAEENYVTAAKLSHYLLQYATKSRDREALKSAVLRDKFIKESQKKHEVARTAVTQLSKNPDDQEANYRVGLYLTFVRGDWQRGSSRLAKGSDEALRTVAAQEIANPSTAPKQKELGDAWWNYAIENKNWSASARSRAQYWYEQAVDQLPGLDKAVVEKRLGELASKGLGDNGAAGNKKGSIAVDLAKGVRMNFQRIPAGKFMMGSPNTEAGRKVDEVLHPVMISKSFYMHATEVTLAQWLVVMGNTPPGNTSPNFPVATVKRDDCIEFCNRLQKKFVARGFQFRLPTEAEWEYACRAGSSGVYCFGDDARQLPDYAWYLDNGGGAAREVAMLKPNRWGLYDMHGNVNEWVSDLHGPYDLNVLQDPKGPAAGQYTKRGGAYLYPPGSLRSAWREGHSTDDARAWIGFRVALDVN